VVASRGRGSAVGAAVSLTLSELALFLEGSELVGRKMLVPPTFDDKNLAVKIPM
jgi:hypothetical protein